MKQWMILMAHSNPQQLLSICPQNKFYQRERVLAEILNALEPLFDGLPGNIETIQSHWEAACGHLNETVHFHHGNEIVNGIFKSLGEAGSALLEIDGQENRFYSGEIS